MKNLGLIGLVWLGCAIAWLILGSTILVRSGSTSSQLATEVHLLWGPPMQQLPPRAIYHEPRIVRETVTRPDANGQPTSVEIQRTEDAQYELGLQASTIHANLALEHRRKGLVWFPTYGVSFRGRYELLNDTGQARDVEMSFPLMAETAVYDGFAVVGEDGSPIATEIREGRAYWTKRLAPGEQDRWTVSYRSRGTSQWHYQPAMGTGQVRNFSLIVQTDFPKVDFPAGTISPSRHGPVDGGWRGEWTFESLVSSAAIGIELPRLLNPGPLASKITFFAPVGLLFFVFVVAVLAASRRQDIHPLNYFFFGCAFFAFHLLFAYLVDHLPIGASFTIASAVSVLLVVSYARLFVGWRFALVEMGLSQLIYLVLFSFTFFWEGFTGLAITVGAVMTLFVIMQMTGRVRWQTLAPSRPAAPTGLQPETAVTVRG